MQRSAARAGLPRRRLRAVGAIHDAHFGLAASVLRASLRVRAESGNRVIAVRAAILHAGDNVAACGVEEAVLVDVRGSRGVGIAVFVEIQRVAGLDDGGVAVRATI